MHASYLIIGGGLSGLAAAVRLARFKNNVLLLERHSRLGGLNSYYYRHNRLFETGLHAITNYADRTEKRAPLNQLLRQLKLDRERIEIRQQLQSRIIFPGDRELSFTNDFESFHESIKETFPESTGDFEQLLKHLDSADPLRPAPFLSGRQVLRHYLRDRTLEDMLLCPLLYYGSSWEDDIDFSQLVILFRAMFQEGLFRPGGTIKELLELLVEQLESYGGKIRLQSEVKKISTQDDRVLGVVLADGTEISCDYLLSTIGLRETRQLLGAPLPPESSTRLSFVENLYLCKEPPPDLSGTTIIFFCTEDHFSFKKPNLHADLNSGVICLPGNFADRPAESPEIELRTTHLANYERWLSSWKDRTSYLRQKQWLSEASLARAEQYLGPCADSVIYRDSFTPVTIERYTGKLKGSVYGGPEKAKSGHIGLENCFLAGTDQGFLGIVGAMLSGVAIVNRHILPK